MLAHDPHGFSEQQVGTCPENVYRPAKLLDPPMIAVAMFHQKVVFGFALLAQRALPRREFSSRMLHFIHSSTLAARAGEVNVAREA